MRLRAHLDLRQQADKIGQVYPEAVLIQNGVDALSRKCAGKDRTETSIKVSVIALLAGLIRPDFVEWLKGRAKSTSSPDD
jgi:hypothetical protein